MEQRSPLSGPHYDMLSRPTIGTNLQILKISLETNSFAKGIRDLYRVIAPIASRKVTVSPRISPGQFFPNKIFSQNMFLDWAYSGGAYLREGVSF